MLTHFPCTYEIRLAAVRSARRLGKLKVVGATLPRIRKRTDCRGVEPIRLVLFHYLPINSIID